MEEVKFIRRQCEACPTWFTPSRMSQRFCTKRCSNRWHQEQHRIRRGELLHKEEERECPECHSYFRTRTANQTHCSTECRQAERDRAQALRQATYIAEREGVHAVTGNPREAYNAMKALANELGRDWTITYAHWWREWSKVWDKRGAYRMYRLDRSEGYLPRNIAVMTPEVAAVYYEEPFNYKEIV